MPYTPRFVKGRGGGAPTSFLGGLLAHTGLIAFTLVGIGLVVYLLYSMIHPERF
jgi:K+-transporting ATPase KdpF subunit